MTDHYLLMTATPHKGNPENFCLFLSLLDKDVYGDVKSLEEAMTRQDAPFYLRRVKEALVSFPDPETGKVKALFTKRIVKTSEFAIDTDEYELYDQLTTYVENQSIRAARDDSARGPGSGFHDGDAPAALRIEYLCRAAQSGADEGKARAHSRRPGKVQAGANCPSGFRRISRSCPKKNSRK